jgi:hypothetical protein
MQSSSYKTENKIWFRGKEEWSKAIRATGRLDHYLHLVKTYEIHHIVYDRRGVELGRFFQWEDVGYLL